MTITTAVEQTIAGLRDDLARLHALLKDNELVVWSAGNVSARVPGADLMVIKPSGLLYDALTPEVMVVTDLHGNLVDGERSPSSDTFAHAYVYRHLPEVGGVVHTHSTYAVAWAAREQPIPCVSTMQADEFGGDIPLGPFALIGDDSIGAGIVQTLTGSRSTAVIMARHGPFTIGPDARSAVKSAVLCEEVAKATHLAMALSPQPQRLAEEHITSLYERYHHVYGQR